MTKLKMHTPDLVANNIEWIAARFPGCITESRNEQGKVVRAVDFDLLRQELSPEIVEGPQERYHLNWPGKREALLAANAPIAKTLRPCREESVDFDTTRNLFIEGDNLDALKLLQETYLNKVKMIYIDPPYNTGKEFIYNDNFTASVSNYMERSGQATPTGNRMVANTESNGRFHSDWLSMIYPRLKLAKNLLANDGILFITIDDHENARMRHLCEEIFGEDNFIATLVWQKRYSRENRGSIGDAHDYVLVFAKSTNDFARTSGRIPITEEQAKIYRNPNNDAKGRWRGIPMTAQGHRPNQMYPIMGPTGIIHTPPEGRCWSMIESAYRELLETGRIYFGADGTSQPQVIRYLSEVEGFTPWTWVPHEIGGHTDEAKKEIYSILGKDCGFDTPKPVKLIRHLLQIASSSKDYLVVDFFAGSGTTAQAVLEANIADGGSRQCILIQLDESCTPPKDGGEPAFETIAEIAKERIRRIGRRCKEEAGLHGDAVDVGFRVLKIDSSNMKDVYYRPDEATPALLGGHVDNIKDDRTDEDLLFQVLLDWGVDLSLPIAKEDIRGKPVYFVDTNAFAACFAAGIDEDFVKDLAARKPLRAVFRDSGYGADDVKINVEQIFKQLSPGTEVKTL